MDRERPPEGGGQRVKTRTAPRPHQALSLVGVQPTLILYTIAYTDG